MKPNDITTVTAFDRFGNTIASLSRTGFANNIDAIETLREECTKAPYRFRLEFIMKGRKRVRFYTAAGRISKNQSCQWYQYPRLRTPKGKEA